MLLTLEFDIIDFGLTFKNILPVYLHKRVSISAGLFMEKPFKTKTQTCIKTFIKIINCALMCLLTPKSRESTNHHWFTVITQARYNDQEN